MRQSQKLTHAQIDHLRREYLVHLRDVASRLLDDPHEAEHVVRGLFRSLRRVKADAVGQGEKAARWLEDNLVDRCIRRFERMVQREVLGEPRRRHHAA